MSLEIGQVFAGYQSWRVLGSVMHGLIWLPRPRYPPETRSCSLRFDRHPEFRARFNPRSPDLAAPFPTPTACGCTTAARPTSSSGFRDYCPGPPTRVPYHPQSRSGCRSTRWWPSVTAFGRRCTTNAKPAAAPRRQDPGQHSSDRSYGQPRRVFLADFGSTRHRDASHAERRQQ